MVELFLAIAIIFGSYSVGEAGKKEYGKRQFASGARNQCGEWSYGRYAQGDKVKNGHCERIYWRSYCQMHFGSDEKAIKTCIARKKYLLGGKVYGD